MKSSTGFPAFTSIITLRGRSREATSSSMLRAPMNFFPEPRPWMKASTFDTVLLYTATVNPLLSMFNTRFSPITANPINPMSANFFIFLLYYNCEYF